MAKRKSRPTAQPFDGKVYDTMRLGFRSNYVYQSVLTGLEHEVNQMAGGRKADSGCVLDLQDDLRRLAQYRAQYLTGERANVDHAIDLAIRIGARAQALGIERLVEWEKRRKTSKRTSDETRAATAARRKELAGQLYANLSTDHKRRGKMHVYREVARQMGELLTNEAGEPVSVKAETVRKVYLQGIDIGNG